MLERLEDLPHRRLYSQLVPVFAWRFLGIHSLVLNSVTSSAFIPSRPGVPWRCPGSPPTPVDQEIVATAKLISPSLVVCRNPPSVAPPPEGFGTHAFTRPDPRLARLRWAPQTPVLGGQLIHVISLPCKAFANPWRYLDSMCLFPLKLLVAARSCETLKCGSVQGKTP